MSNPGGVATTPAVALLRDGRWSLDASLAFADMVAGPEEFYKYAVGQPITHPGGYKVKITKPVVPAREQGN